MANDNKKGSVFIVDYDLPLNHPCTRKFYRDIKAVLNGSARSTKSVFTIEDKEKAKIIHNLAAKCGRANLYEAKQIE